MNPGHPRPRPFLIALLVLCYGYLAVRIGISLWLHI